MKTQVNITLDYLFSEDYKRILNAEHLNMVNKPYSQRYLNKMKIYYEGLEEYEKCDQIRKYIDSRFPHGIGWLIK